MSFDSLSGRVFATLAALLVALLGGAALFGEARIRALHAQEVRARLATAADLLVPQAADVLEGRADLEAFARHAETVGHATRLRLTLTDARGDVLVDSGALLPLPNHGDRPEVRQALERGQGGDRRRSTTTGKETLYESRLVERDGRSLGVVRAAAELPEQDPALRALHASLLLGGAAALGAGLLASAFLASRLARPLDEIGRQAVAVAGGDLESTIRVDGPREVRALAETINRMAYELRERLEATRRAQSETSAILASMAEGVVAVDDRERVLTINRAASEALGLERPPAPGSHLWERVRFPELEKALRAVLGGAASWHGDAPSPRGDGRMLALSVAPVGGDGEGFRGAVALLSDVTQIRALEQMRIDFVANVSHELRTPLAAVMGALETLTDPEQDEAVRRRFLDIANRNAERLQAIVSDLLDLSSIEAEGDAMPLEPLEADEPLERAARALAGAAETKGIVLAVAPPSEPAWVAGNAQRLEQAFTNLLENAIKYTRAGGSVRARVRTLAREVRVEVEDTGIGIPAAALPRVFERFYRVDRSRSREMGGTGLGLAIVKHVVRAHGGLVEVESVEGRGTTFAVVLPRIRPPGA